MEITDTTYVKVLLCLLEQKKREGIGMPVVFIDLPCYLYEFPAYDSTMDGVFVRMDALPMQTVSFPHGSHGKRLTVHLVAFAYACRTLFVDELDMFSHEFFFLYHRLHSIIFSVR